MPEDDQDQLVDPKETALVSESSEPAAAAESEPPRRANEKIAVSALGTFLEDATGRGLFPLVAYGVDNEEFHVLTTSIADLPLGMKILKEINREYNLGRSLQVDRLTKLSRENPHVYRRHTRKIEGLCELDLTEVGRLVGLYGTPYFAQRAFGLVDICGFSRLDSSEQLAQLYSLTNVLGASIRRCSKFSARLGVRNVFGRASTGDGFYVWTDGVGGNADVATFMLLASILGQCEEMRAGGFPMRVKASFVIGGAFMLYDPTRRSGRELSEPAANAVGPATNGASRLLAACKPGQLLVGDFSRSGQGRETLNPAALIAQANELFREEKTGAGRLAIAPNEKLRVEDKHGEAWYCWNVCGELPRNDTWTVIGLHPDSSRDIADVRFR